MVSSWPRRKGVLDGAGFVLRRGFRARVNSNSGVHELGLGVGRGTSRRPMEFWSIRAARGAKRAASGNLQ